MYPHAFCSGTAGDNNERRKTTGGGYAGDDVADSSDAATFSPANTSEGKGKVGAPDSGGGGGIDDDSGGDSDSGSSGGSDGASVSPSGNGGGGGRGSGALDVRDTTRSTVATAGEQGDESRLSMSSRPSIGRTEAAARDERLVRPGSPPVGEAGVIVNLDVTGGLY